MSELSRRTVLKATAAAGIASALGAGTGGMSMAEAARRDVIRRENERPGTTDWQLTYTRVDPATRFRCPWIEGYVSRASVRAGETLDIMVSTKPAAPFTIDLYRMGYYGGAGARHVMSLGPFGQGTDPVFRSAEPPLETGVSPGR